MDTRYWIAGAALALVVLGGSLYVGGQIAEANRPAMTAPAPVLAPPELDPAYAAGSVKLAAEMGLTASELRRRYQEGADACGITPEAFWGIHARRSQRWDPAEALEAEIKYCQIKRDNP